MKKREFLSGGIGISVGLATSAVAQAQTRSQLGNHQNMLATMLDSSNFFGEASKTGGFEASFAGSGKQTSTVDKNYKPKRLNKAIELWEDNQPVFYAAYGPAGVADGYQMGKLMAKTWCDAINYEMEHCSFDYSNLRSFMQGLVDGGPTASGHRVPMVFVTLPMLGFDAYEMRANSWAIRQALAAGVHGVSICHMRDPGAAEVMVAAARYPFEIPGGKTPPLEGTRGQGSQAYASHIWGITESEYFEKADVWPLNPIGELSLGVKIEDKHALENAERTLATPGIAFAEGGGGDMAMSIFGLSRLRPMSDSERMKLRADISKPLLDAEARVEAACRANGVRWLGDASALPIWDMGRGPSLAKQVAAGMQMYPGLDERQVFEARESVKRRMPI